MDILPNDAPDASDSGVTLPTIYKFLTEDMRSPMGKGAWTLNRWRSARGEIVPCENGLHGVSVDNLTGYADATLWRAEVDGDYVWHGRGSARKIVVRRMRIVERVEAWNDKTARLFATDCAERVLPIFEREHPNDQRPRQAIEAARRFANGQTSREELDAAWAAARDAASVAAWEAASAAAWAAARDVASVAARDAASDAAHDWQNRHLAGMLGLPWDVEAQP